MANTRSALKQMRQNKRRRLRNAGIRSRVRAAVKAARGGLDSREAAQGAVRQAAVLVDKAASRGVLHRNTAARIKSRLARRLSQAPAQPAAGH